MNATALKRFEAKVERVTESGCWLWLGTLSNGYPEQCIKRRKRFAARLAYQHYRPDEPEPTHLDRSCGVAICVNPWHATPRERPLLERFLDNISKTIAGCWEWTGYRDPKGYGRLRNDDEPLAHRVSWLLHRGETGDLHVLHKCDNPPCVNPDHLFLGTNQDNVEDKVRKGRSGKGGWPATAHLTAVLLISLLIAGTAHAAQHVTRVIDGDTVVVERVGSTRLIGVDAPETVHPTKPVQACGPEASAYMKAALPPGTVVRLMYGPRRRDKYGRVLAYVYVSGRLLNRDLVERGLAHAERAYPHKRMAEFIAAEDRAKAAHLGLWATVPCGSGE